MNAALANACWFFFLAISPVLLTIRFFWPRVLPRWGVLVFAGALGGTAFYLNELLHQADMEKFVRMRGGFDQLTPVLVDGMVNVPLVRPIDFVVGAVLELILLLLWLVPYGIIQILRKRAALRGR